MTLTRLLASPLGRNSPFIIAIAIITIILVVAYFYREGLSGAQLELLKWAGAIALGLILLSDLVDHYVEMNDLTGEAAAWCEACESLGLAVDHAEPVKNDFPPYVGTRHGRTVHLSRIGPRGHVWVRVEGEPKPGWRSDPALADTKDPVKGKDAGLLIAIPLKRATTAELDRLIRVLASHARARQQ